ncbi:hypothetical protein QN239_17580 [Mycolicibacterium sp. Y3]
MNTLPLRLAHSPQDYQALGLRPGQITADEQRTHVDGSPGTMEWWFMKADLDDCMVAIGILTCPLFMAELGLKPAVSLFLTLPDGTVIDSDAIFSADDWSSAPGDDCDIQVGKNRFRRIDANTYHAHFENNGYTVDLELTPTAPEWRPEAGHIIFGENDANFFGWSIPVPAGDTHVVIRGNGLDIDSRGTGYIDRGWMNKPLGEFLHDWNWFHWEFNDYTVLAVYMTFEQEYGYPDIPFFMVFRGSQLLAGGPGTQNSEHITYSTESSQVDPVTGKPAPDAFAYYYRDGATRFTLSVTNETATAQINFADVLPGTDEEKSRASIYGGAMLRFTGPAELTHYENDQVVERVKVRTGPFYELMYMGAAPVASGDTGV